MLQRICDSIDACIALLSPSDLVFIAFDGVAPVAKLNQQRERRYKSWYLGEMETQRRKAKTKGDGKTKGDKAKGAPKPAWNTSAITPGTNFMCALHAKLAQHYNTKTNTTATTTTAAATTATTAAATTATTAATTAATTTTTTPKIIVSSSNEPGEGEHKIFEYIREHASEHADKTSVIYGLDADLIMLCMSHLHISRNIYLYRETPAFAGTVHVALDEKEKYYMDIPEFAEAVMENLRPIHPGDKVSRRGAGRNAWHLGSPDYIFMCFMLGNDFMPHFPALNIRTTGIATLMDAYRATFGPGETIIQLHAAISSPWSIHWPNYRRFVAHLAAQELTLIRKEHASRDRQARHLRDSDMEDDVMHDVLMLPMTQRDVERQINPFEPGWERRYYAALCDIHVADVDDKAIASLCRNYLEGMEWTFRYYTTGCVDWKWTYANHYPPLLADLAKYMSGIPETQTNTFSFLSVKPKEPIRDVVQLCYVLPRASHALLPPAAERALMRSKLRSKYTDDGSPNFKWAYCKYFWECHTDLPELDLEELAQIVST
jgi:5'-3' exonuclease